MKTKLILSLLALSALLLVAGKAHAGPVSKGGFVISKPGKYTLIRNLTAKAAPDGFAPFGIVVTVNDVEIDLAGFTIAPPPGAEGVGIGISIAGGVERVRIQNGRIRDFSIGIGVGTAQKDAADCTFERLHISRSADHGFLLYGDSLVVRACSVMKVQQGANGISILGTSLALNEVSDCTVSSAQFAGVGIVNAGDGVLVVRRCAVHRFVEGYRGTPMCKFFDNVSSDCTQAFTGGPVLIGVNN